jgi:MoaA/NifB/PqqE/SkfB family radical SAM enzyme
MTREETFAFLEYIAKLKPPSLLLSGGEPLMHPDFFEIVSHAAALGLKISLSTNGTRIDQRTGTFLKEQGVGYVGVSLDGGDNNPHDAFRGVDGAFERALTGIRALKTAGCRVGLRFTMARPLLPELPRVASLTTKLAVDRICFYHFIPSGRGREEKAFVPSRGEMRDVLRYLFGWADQGQAPEEVLTVGNFADGILLYLTLKENDDPRAEGVLALLSAGGGGRSGRGILSVRWDGITFADQFSWHRPIGHWTRIATHLRGEKETSPRLPALGGRCGRCRWLPLCRGNMRARAWALTGDPLGEDPGCTLEDREISEKGATYP